MCLYRDVRIIVDVRVTGVGIGWQIAHLAVKLGSGSGDMWRLVVYLSVVQCIGRYVGLVVCLWSCNLFDTNVWARSGRMIITFKVS